MRQIRQANLLGALVLLLSARTTWAQDQGNNPTDIVVVLKTLKEEGYKFDFETNLILNPDTEGNGVKIFMSFYKNDRATITVFRNSEGDKPGSKWRLTADKDEANRDKLVLLARKLSPKLGDAAQESLKEFRKGGKNFIRRQVIQGVDLEIRVDGFHLSAGV